MNATIKRPTPTTAARNTLIIEDDTLVGLGIRTALEQLGHYVVGQAANAAEALKYFFEYKPDLLLVDIRLQDDDGIALVTDLMRHRRVPAIILSAYSDRELVQRAGAAPIFGYLVKPVEPNLLAAQIEVAVRRFDDQEQLLAEKRTLSAAIEERKLVEKAKGLLMRHLNITEPDAHKRLQQESQKRRLPMSELAKRLIESDQLLGRSAG